MAQNAPPADLMHYEAMAQDALRGVVKSALKRVAQDGLPGDHHFYITFRTRAPGVSAPPELLAKYPDEMTIVLQRQFWDLAPGETFFSVTLSFGKEPKKLSIPYAAVTVFYDPSVQFRLVFEVPVVPTAEPEPEPAPAPKQPEPATSTADGDAPKVVSLDQFRKK
ncbi:MAG TPA: ClpXP protease specificity-enhancing factor SspB [Caulobacteraceae bacterium]|jgi:hypothetical protein|nr:ClpXP protease specificity-enhancing factor SspB [Caulobacteraceae bacterium]